MGAAMRKLGSDAMLKRRGTDRTVSIRTAAVQTGSGFRSLKPR